MPDLPWYRKAACRGEPLDLFFPDGDGARWQPQIAHAKAICASCPVIRECRDHAHQTPEKYGLWAGLTEEERGLTRRNWKRRSQTSQRREATG